MKKVSLVFSTREELWGFLYVSTGVNVSIHQKIYCLTAEFPAVQIELAKEQYHAQVFENIYAPKPPTEAEKLKEKSGSMRFSNTLLL